MWLKVQPHFNFSDEIIILNLGHADSHHNETVQGVGVVWGRERKARQEEESKGMGGVGE